MSPPKKDIEVPTPQYHRMRLNLGTGSDRGDHGTVRSGRWPLTRSGWCPCKKGEFGHRQAHREDARRRWRCRLGRGVYEPRNTRGGRRATEPASHRPGAGRMPGTQTPSWPLGAPTYPHRPRGLETTHLCSWRCVVLCYSSPENEYGVRNRTANAEDLRRGDEAGLRRKAALAGRQSQSFLYL